MNAATVLVTGANGFVGQALVDQLLRLGKRVHAAVRQPDSAPPAAPGLTVFSGLALGAQTDWSASLAGVDAVVHCAARVHVMREHAPDPLREFRLVNVAGTLQLATQAARSGVKRMVYVSSIGVLGAETNGRAFHADDVPAPHSAYAHSKLEAEQALQALPAGSGMSVCIVRPPLVYGPNAPGNFASLARALQRGLPLPLGAVHNRRSLVAIDNLVDLLIRCTAHPGAAGQTFLVSDGEDLSTTALLERMAASMGCRARLLPVPPELLAWLLRLLGRQSTAQSLLASLQIDIAKTRALLDWAPLITVDEALARAAQPAERAAASPQRPGTAGHRH